MQAFLFIRMNGVLRCNSIYERNSYLFDILEFGGESPRTMRYGLCWSNNTFGCHSTGRYLPLGVWNSSNRIFTLL